jgi:hypothetical protein
MVTEPTRTAPLLAATVKVTLPFPLPLAAEVTCTHGA